MMHQPLDARGAGQREKNKIDKLRRIKEAARELFVSKGFDDTTTREIAVRAGVGIGTVFIYADNKRDLLFLVANDELEEITARAEAGMRDDVSCLQNLLTVFRAHYAFFARQPELSRLMLREMTFYDSGRQAERFQTTRERIIAMVGRIVTMAAEHRTIATAEDPALVAWVAFCIYQVELRRWLMTKELSLTKGMAALQHALEVFLRGVEPTEEALRVSTARPGRARRTRAD
jgi:AcrR family transcriptional regulator